MRMGTASAQGIKIKAKVLRFVPLKNTSASIRKPMHIVIDMFGSSMTSTQISAPAPSTGRTPFTVFTFWGLAAKYAAAKSA